jgi:Flp pilus assembly protein TadD, contains TPR repeats
MQNNDFKGAVIQLKNALKRSPEMLPAHVLLAKAYLENGDYASAESELIKANDLGADQSLTLPLLAKSIYYQSRYRQLLKDFRFKNEAVLSKEAKSDIRVYQALSRLEMGDFKKADSLIDEALVDNSGNGMAYAARAKAALTKENWTMLTRLSETPSF